MPAGTARPAILAVALLLAGLTQGAWAQVTGSVGVERTPASTRLVITYPESMGGDLSAEAEIAAGAVLVARFSQPVYFDAPSIPAQTGGLAAMARLDEDGRTLRLALNREAEPHVSVSHNVIAIDLTPPGASAPAPIVSQFERNARAEAQAAAERAAAANVPPPPANVAVRTGEAAEYTRIEFMWPSRTGYALETGNGRAVLRFDAPGEADLRQLSASPPRLIEQLRGANEDSGLTISLRLDEGASARAWDDEDGRRIVLDVLPEGHVSPEAMLAALGGLEPETPPAGEPQAPEPEPVAVAEIRPDPVPENGIVRVRLTRSGNDALLHFEWAHLPGLAVFRRPEAVWLVFDARAELDVSELSDAPRRHMRGFQVVAGEDYTALRIEAPEATLPDPVAAGATWTVGLRDNIDQPSRPVVLMRVTPPGQPARLRIGQEGARSAVRIDDPVMGDSLLVLTADGAKSGVLLPYRMVEAHILPSVHGVAVQPLADDLELALLDGGAQLSRPGGMALSRSGGPASMADAVMPTSPAFTDLAAWRGNEDYQSGLTRALYRASGGEPNELLNLARFYLAWELAPEALGAARLAAQADSELADSVELRVINGIAMLMMGRLPRAEVFLSGSALNEDPAVQPWRGLIAARRSDWPEARRRFDAAEGTGFFLDPLWRARIQAAHARAAAETGDIGTALRLLDGIDAELDDPQARAEAEFAAARVAALSGRNDEAIRRFAALAEDPWLPIQAVSLLNQVRLELAEERIAPTQAADMLASTALRWRGDDTELEAARQLGALYAEAGRYGEALEVMSQARLRQPGSAAARRIASDMDALFRRLFLDDEAARMSPLEALSLFNEYASLTPQGADGDRMVRRVAERLVAVDLLDPAAQLLQHQVDNRSMPAQARAAIASDLAVIYLMGRRHEEALRTLRATRVTGLSPALVTERRLLEARAMAGIGRADHALEMIGDDDSAPARRLRADIAWEQRDWAGAARGLEAVLGARWREDGPLTDTESRDVMRAAIAYALVGDSGSLERIEARYGEAMATTRHRGGFSLVTTELPAPGDRRLTELVSSLASRGTMDAFLAGFARRFEAGADQGPS
ncbi:hypothetical protein [Glycocaulis sp.]|uniref:tetratricopeptide repeat protein n=1 Tax=Glycocaulis sp. TaxID=1969725 RepID=UPI003D1AB2C2